MSTERCTRCGLPLTAHPSECPFDYDPNPARPVQADYESFVVETTRELVVEAPCKRGCEIHSEGEYRLSLRLPADTSVDYGRILMERHAEEHPASGPYRLVENVTEIRTTKEVLEP